MNKLTGTKVPTTNVKRDIDKLREKKTKFDKKIASPSAQYSDIQNVMEQVVLLIGKCKVHVKAFRQYAATSAD